MARKKRQSETEMRLLAKDAERFFDRVKASRERAENLRKTADLIEQHLGDPKGMRYDGVGGKTGPYTDAMVDAITRLETAKQRAINAAEAAENLVAEAYCMCTQVLERPDMDDSEAILTVLEYYVEGRSLNDMAFENSCSIPSVSRAKTRGLLYLQYTQFNHMVA